ncbi:unnamed protein product, partial [Didymodactylos carnosus]
MWFIQFCIEYLTTSIVPTVIVDNIVWPNGIISADERIFGFPYSIIVPDKFLVSSKTKGNLYLIPPPFTGQQPIPLVPSEQKLWFYHDAVFNDMDLDGYVDIVTARANVPLVSQPVGELIWLTNPGNSSKEIWIINHIADADLNGDSRVELLVPCNDVKNGSFVVYELPIDDFRSGEIVKHSLATNFKPLSESKGRGASGSALVVDIYDQRKPVITLSGDDDGCAYLLVAQSEDVADWNYTLTKFHQ